MKNFWQTLSITVITLGVFAAIIIIHERHLATGKDIYVRLAPADPRSLIQGDYMTLNYELFLPDTKITLKHSHTLWVYTDSQSKLTQSYLDQQPNTRPLIIKSPHGSVFSSYPAAKSFLFAEGLGKCYQNATYAHLKTNTQGKPILVNLVNDDLQDLACEQKTKDKLQKNNKKV